MYRKILQLKSRIPFHAEYVNILANTFSFVEAECSKRNSGKSEEFVYFFTMFVGFFVFPSISQCFIFEIPAELYDLVKTKFRFRL